MQLNELTNEELLSNLQRLHEYLNSKYFGGKLSSVMVEISSECSSAAEMDSGHVLRFGLQAMTRYRTLKFPGPEAVKRQQLKWMVTTMLHVMIDQYVMEGGADAPEAVAERVGLIDYNTRTEWINPIRFAFIEKGFQLRHIPSAD